MMQYVYIESNILVTKTLSFNLKITKYQNKIINLQGIRILLYCQDSNDKIQHSMFLAPSPYSTFAFFYSSINIHSPLSILHCQFSIAYAACISLIFSLILASISLASSGLSIKSCFTASRP